VKNWISASYPRCKVLRIHYADLGKSNHFTRSWHHFFSAPFRPELYPRCSSAASHQAVFTAAIMSAIMWCNALKVGRVSKPNWTLQHGPGQSLRNRRTLIQSENQTFGSPLGFYHCRWVAVRDAAAKLGERRIERLDCVFAAAFVLPFDHETCAIYASLTDRFRKQGKFTSRLNRNVVADAPRRQTYQLPGWKERQAGLARAAFVQERRMTGTRGSFPDCPDF